MKKLSSDIRVILTQAFLGMGIVAYILAVRPNPSFARGLLLGYGVAAFLTLAFIVLFRIRGRRRFGDMDERESRVLGSASLITVFTAIMGMALFILLSQCLPALRGLSATELAALATGGMGAILGISYAILNR